MTWLRSMAQRRRALPLMLVSAFLVGTALGPGITIADQAMQRVFVTNTAANPVPVSGTVTLSGTPTVNVGNLPATQPVSGTVGISGTPTVNVGTMPAITPATAPKVFATSLNEDLADGTAHTFTFTGTINVTSIVITDPVAFFQDALGGKQSVSLSGVVPGQATEVALWEGPRSGQANFSAPLALTGITVHCFAGSGGDCHFALTVVGY